MKPVSLYLPVRDDCRHFTGYKPCKFKRPCEGCTDFSAQGERVLVIAPENPESIEKTERVSALAEDQAPKQITVVTLPENVEAWKRLSWVHRCMAWDDLWRLALGVEKFSRTLVLGKDPRADSMAKALSAIATRTIPTRNQADSGSPKIIVIHLEALGAVLQSTAILPALKRKFPKGHVTWLTSRAALPLLKNNSLIDEVLSWSPDIATEFDDTRFDMVMSLDKAPGPASLAVLLDSQNKYGFGWGPQGNLYSLSPKGDYAFSLGLDNELKFKTNQKTNQEIFCDLADLPYSRDEYQLELSTQEKQSSQEYRKAQAPDSDGIIGINTGCADNFPYKKFTISRHQELVEALLEAFPKSSVFLLGGRAETERNNEIAEPFKGRQGLEGRVVKTPTQEGLRSGIVYENACDLVISGDTLGMHIAIGLRKKVVAWFSLTCQQEIDIYDRGTKLLADVTCGPCWLSSCDQEPKCYNQVPVSVVIEAVGKLQGTPEKGLKAV